MDERRRRRAGPLLLVLTLTGAMAVVAHARRITSYNSDLAVVALMAQDILYRGAHPVFFDGSEYAGTLEQHFVALFFAVLPDRPAVQEIAIAIELAVGVALVWGTARSVFGPRAALASGLYLALGPVYFYYRGLTSAGPYTPLFTIGAGVLAVLIRSERRALAGEPVDGELAVLGLLLGLAWWTHPLGAAFGGCAAVSLLFGAARRRLTPLGIAGGTLAFFVGSLPWWWRNLHTGWASLTGPDVATLPWRQLGPQVRALVTVGLPVLLGARPAWAKTDAFPGAGAVALLVLAALAGFGGSLLFRREPRVRHAAAVFLSLTVFTAALALPSRRLQLTEPRALFTFYLSLAPLAGAFLACARLRRPLRGSLCAGLAVLHLAGHAAAPRIAPFPMRVIERLEQRQVHAVYTSYWSAYLLTFLSRGRIVGTPFGHGVIVRRAQDRSLVDAAEAPAFVFDREEPARWEEPARLESFLKAGGFRYHREVVDGLQVFTDLPPQAVAVVRGCYCIPAGLTAEAVVWRGVSGPPQIAQGQTARYRVQVKNGARLSWSLNTNLAYHWRRPDGSDAVFDGRRTPPAHPPRPGETLTVDMDVEANVEPGDYTLVIDAVEEGVSWFEARGARPLLFSVRVEPR
jgi:hypothetical protein